MVTLVPTIYVLQKKKKWESKRNKTKYSTVLKLSKVGTFFRQISNKNGRFDNFLLHFCLFFSMNIFFVNILHKFRGSPTYTKITNTVSTTYHGFWLMYLQVGDFRVSRGTTTVPLTQISCNTPLTYSQGVTHLQENH